MKRYTQKHEWIAPAEGGRYRVGITDFAQEQLGDVVSVELPEVGDSLAAGNECAVIESVKVAEDIYSPVAGEVAAVNDSLSEKPELVNESPEENGWLWEMTVADEGALSELMDDAAYRAYCDSEGGGH